MRVKKVTSKINMHRYASIHSETPLDYPGHI